VRAIGVEDRGGGGGGGAVVVDLVPAATETKDLPSLNAWCE